MAEQAQPDIVAEAIAWHLRLRDGSDDDWVTFTAWLEGDPARSDAYDAVALADAELIVDAFPARAANDDGALVRRRWATGVVASAALLLVALLAIPRGEQPSGRYEIATAAGERRSVAIGDGSSAELNGATRLILDRADSRFAELASGEAMFTVRHDPAHPFVVLAGDHRVEDAGTRFNLVRDRDTLAVEVIEGAVIYDPQGAAMPLSAGQTLRGHAGGRPETGSREPGAMAGWRQGRLSYTAAPLERVTRDLSRSLGVEVAIDPSIATMPFTGSIRVEGDAAASLRSLAGSVGLEARRTGNTWRIEPHARPPR